ncbi:MAG: glycosyl transferase, partial [Candidatus Harrisonbacteria bacterium CG10_big_fil_rev_8_21_14_0_10_49_15]
VYERFGYLREDMPLAGGYEFMLRVLEKEGVRSCYLSRIAVKMRGRKRLSALGRLLEMTRGNIQAYRAWRLNGLKISPLFILRKPFSKIKQIISKTRAI